MGGTAGTGTGAELLLLVALLVALLLALLLALPLDLLLDLEVELDPDFEVDEPLLDFEVDDPPLDAEAEDPALEVGPVEEDPLLEDEAELLLDLAAALDADDDELPDFDADDEDDEDFAAEEEDAELDLPPLWARLASVAERSRNDDAECGVANECAKCSAWNLRTAYVLCSRGISRKDSSS